MKSIEKRLKALEQAVRAEEGAMVADFLGLYVAGTKAQVDALFRWLCQGGGAIEVNPMLPVPEDEARRDQELAAIEKTHPELFERVLIGELTPQSAKSQVFTEQWNAMTSRYSPENPFRLDGGKGGGV